MPVPGAPIAATATRQSGALLLFSSIGSSFLQPLLGAFADRIRASWMMPVGTLLAAIGIALVGPVRVLPRDRRRARDLVDRRRHVPPRGRALRELRLRRRRPPGHRHEHVRGRRPERLGARPDPDDADRGRRRAARHRDRGARPARRSRSLLRQPPLPRGLPALGRGRTTPRAKSSARATGAASASPRPRARSAPARSSPSRRSCRCTSGARSTRARASATPRSPRCWPRARFGTLLGGRLSDLHGFRRVVVGSLFAAAPLALFIPVVPLLVLIPADRALRPDQRDELLSARRDRAARRCRATSASPRASRSGSASASARWPARCSACSPTTRRCAPRSSAPAAWRCSLRSSRCAAAQEPT